MITFIHLLRVRVTSIEFEEIDAPLGEGASIQLHVEFTSWVTTTCLRTKVFIDAKL
jgi:hypothetical protein